MSVMSSQRPSPGSSANRDEYLLGLREQIHELIRTAYSQMDTAAFQSSKEEAITGELVRAMNGVIEGDDPPMWALDLFAHEEVPLNVQGAQGKQRPRVDIEVVVKVQRGRRPRFRFESKRLRDSGSVSKYLGEDGLGCFLTGKYAARYEEAGMIGYVQTATEPAWAAQIAADLGESPAKFGIREDGGWRHRPMVAGLAHTYETRHDRASPFGPVCVSHVLLRFLRPTELPEQKGVASLAPMPESPTGPA